MDIPPQDEGSRKDPSLPEILQSIAEAHQSGFQRPLRGGTPPGGPFQGAVATSNRAELQSGMQQQMHQSGPLTTEPPTSATGTPPDRSDGLRADIIRRPMAVKAARALLPGDAMIAGTSQSPGEGLPLADKTNVSHSATALALNTPNTGPQDQSGGGSPGSRNPTPSTATGDTKSCHCKKTRCLKLYCECFAGRVFCKDCSCTDCQNNPDFLDEIHKARKTILQRQPNAFEPKVNIKSDGKHSRGCRCVRSRCLKKYCECFQGGVACSDSCRCENCENQGPGPHPLGPYGQGIPLPSLPRVGRPSPVLGDVAPKRAPPTRENKANGKKSKREPLQTISNSVHPAAAELSLPPLFAATARQAASASQGPLAPSQMAQPASSTASEPSKEQLEHIIGVLLAARTSSPENRSPDWARQVAANMQIANAYVQTLGGGTTLPDASRSHSPPHPLLAPSSGLDTSNTPGLTGPHSLLLATTTAATAAAAATPVSLPMITPMPSTPAPAVGAFGRYFSGDLQGADKFSPLTQYLHQQGNMGSLIAGLGHMAPPLPSAPHDPRFSTVAGSSGFTPAKTHDHSAPVSSAELGFSFPRLLPEPGS